MLLDTSMQVLYPSILVLALYLLFAGHNQPGGGFVGGLVVGGGDRAALRRRAASTRSRDTCPAPALDCSSAPGCCMSASTAIVPVVLGGSILEHGDVDLGPPGARHGQGDVRAVVRHRRLPRRRRPGPHGVRGVRRGRHRRPSSTSRRRRTGTRGAVSDERRCSPPPRRSCSRSARTWCCSASCRRIIIGLGLLGHGANVLLMTSGGGGGVPPIIGTGDPSRLRRPAARRRWRSPRSSSRFGVTAFLLALAYRSWLLTHDDEVEDDVEDRSHRPPPATPIEERRRTRNSPTSTEAIEEARR